MNFPRPPATPPPLEPHPKRFSLEEYAELTKIGFFKEDDRIELIRGELIEMAAKGTKRRNIRFAVSDSSRSCHGC